MNNETYSEYVMVLPDGTESFHPSTQVSEDYRGYLDFESFFKRVVCDAKLTTPRSNPQNIEVKVFGIKTEKGEAKRVLQGNFSIQPPLSQMTEDEYREEMDIELSGLPQEFKDYVESKAYDQGHSAGMEEVVSCARGMAYDLEKVIKAYAFRKGIKDLA